MSNTVWLILISEEFDISHCILQLAVATDSTFKTVLYKWLSVRYSPPGQDSVIIPIISIGGILLNNIPIRRAGSMYEIEYGRHPFVQNYIAIRKELTERNFHLSHV